MEKFIFEDLPSTKTPLSAENLNKMQDNLIDLIYPIGSIFLSTNDVNPTSYLGGTWQQIKDVFLLSSGDKYKAGSRGGEAQHTLTIDEMPDHTHRPFESGSGNDWTWTTTWTQNNGKNSWDEKGGSFLGSAGNNKPFNNMPPYLTVYMWERIS